MRRRFFAAAAAFTLLLVSTRPVAQGRRPMSLLDIADLPRVLGPDLSPDGRFVVYALSHPDWKLNRPVWNLWLQEVGGGQPVRLTTGDNMAPGFTRWSPDGKTILFAQAGQLYLMNPDGGEPRALTKHATGVSSPAWSPDGATVYFLADQPKSAEERERDRATAGVYSYDDDFQQKHLWKISVATGAEQALTSDASSVVSYRLSRDGRKIVMARAPSPLAADANRAEVWTIDTADGKAQKLTDNSIEESDPELSPDNSQVLLLANANAQLEPYYNQNLFLIPASGGTPRALLPDFPYEIDRATWGAGGRTIIAVANMGVHSEILEIDVAARTYKQLTDGQHGIPAAPSPAFSFDPRSERLVFLFDEPERFGDVYVMPLQTKQATRVTHVYDTFATTFALPRQERFQWKGADGATVEGLLMLPADYERGKRYPLVVQMHGGPAESDKFGAGSGFFQSYFPVLTGRGYVVLRPNFRGSAGYSNAFYRDVIGHYFQNMHTDVLTAVDALIAQGVVDGDQMVLMGWSAGAHLTNKLITVTSRFKAASSGAGVANWVSLHAQTDDRFRRTVWFGGTPWQTNAPIDVYWNSSPIKDVARAKTPTLFFAGDRDVRVPMAQSIEMFQALKSNGVPTQLLILPGEGHQVGQLRHLLAKANAELAWFEKYARGRAYTPEKAP